MLAGAITALALLAPVSAALVWAAVARHRAELDGWGGC